MLDSFVSVKGDKKFLTENNRKLFICLNINEYGFTGITNHLTELKESIPEIISERINLEALMLAYIEGGKHYA